MNTLLGVLLTALGGFAAASCYISFKKVRNWAWETYWLVNAFIGWIVFPLVFISLTVPNFLKVLMSSPSCNILACFFFGVLWGVGGLTFGLSLRYLGFSLGYALALGYCALFGTLIPPLYFGTFGKLITTISGLTTIVGILVCLIGIGICAWAGIVKEKELFDEQKQKISKEYNFKKGIWIALICGIMSACFAFGIAAGKPIAAKAFEHGASQLLMNGPVFIIILAGGFTTNFMWCIFLNIKNHTWTDYFKSNDASLISNYFFSGIAGTIWYCQNIFYGMGTIKMGEYDFSSWSILMAFIIVFSNIWALIFKEWKGTSRRTQIIIVSGIMVLIVSTMVIGLGSYLSRYST